MKELSLFTESELRALRSKLEVERSSACSAMIAAGRGHETTAETLAKATLPDADALTVRFAKSCTAFQALRDEEERRREYHGSLKRIQPRLSRRFAGFNP